ncbi:MAG TPA: phage major capsid protein [Candidatus Brocadiales bacterium]|nr:phage major capsid protein [Candidatus Brocadiales bacterium]
MTKELLDKVKQLEKMMEGMPDSLERHKEALASRIDEIVKDKFDVVVGKAMSPRKLEFPVMDAEARYGEFSNKCGFSFGRFFQAIATRDWSKAPLERKALGEGTGSAGGFLVPEQYLGEVKDRITARAIVRRAGATVYPMATDTLNVPKVTGGATAYWIGENAQITASDETLDQLQLVAKLLAAMVKVSNQLLSDASPSAEAAIRRDIAKVIALAEDNAFIAGTGTGNQPLGIINTTGVNGLSLGANGATPTFDNIYDALYQVENNNGLASAWVMHPRTKNTLKKIKDSTGNFIYNVAPSVKEPDTLVGLPVYLTTQIPTNLTVGTSTDCSYILVGQFDEAIIGERAGLEFSTDQSGTAFEYYQTWIRAIARLDFGLRTPGVFCKVTGVRP